MACVNFDKKIIYLHIPKTAGSYLQNILPTNYGFINFKLRTLQGEHSAYDENKGVSYYFSHPENMVNLGIDKTFFVFTFVRNPYTRFISGWKFSIQANLIPNISLEELIIYKDSISRVAYIHTFLTQYNNIKFLDINFIGRYERLEEHLSIFLNYHGFIRNHNDK